MIETAIFATLSTSAAVTALAGTRVYPATLPKDPTLPAVVYRFIGGAATPTMDTAGKQRARLQLDCIAETYSDAITLRKAVVQTLAGYRSAAFQAQVLNATTDDGFDQDLLQYLAICEVYIWFSL
jgi:Protein of unknown function (DUF3168)